VDSSFHGLDTAGLGAFFGLTNFVVASNHVYAFNNYAVLFEINRQNLALLSAVSAAVLLGSSDDLN
jgi:hypothetical protein